MIHSGACAMTKDDDDFRFFRGHKFSGNSTDTDIFRDRDRVFISMRLNDKPCRQQNSGIVFAQWPMLVFQF